MRRRLRPALAGAVAFCTLLDIAHAQTADLRAARLTPEIGSLEGGLWGLSDKAETALKTSADLDRDPALNGYVRQVVCKIAAEYCEELRVYVVDRPLFNASAAPNGYMEVQSGLMLRVRTEDELAFVLGHEISHFARNHSLASLDRQKANANIILALQIGVTVASVGAMASAASSGAPNAGQTIDSISRSAQALNNLLYLQGVASFFAFSREQESEADSLGFERATRAGYNKGSGALIWKSVVAEAQTSDFEKTRKDIARGSIFATHPLSEDRIAALSKLAGSDAPAPSLEAQRAYRAHIRPHLAVWLKDELRRRDLGESLYLIGRLEEVGEDLGLLSFYRGEACRLRRQPGDAEKALAAYQSAATHADAPPEAWRALGEALQKAGDRPAAATAFETYLGKAPTAEDRWIVEASLKSLKGS